MEVQFEAAKELYLQHKYFEAAEAYTLIINSCNDRLGQDLLKRALLNRSQCNLQLRNYEEVVADCTKVLNFEHSNPKALKNRYTAFENMDHFQAAMVDLEALTAMYQHPEPELVKARNRITGYLRSDAIALKRDGFAGSLVTDHQVLRLWFLESPPRLVCFEEMFVFRVSVGNEFGLWNRSYMQNSSTTRVFCELSVVVLGSPNFSTAIEKIESTCGNDELKEDGKSTVSARFCRKDKYLQEDCDIVVLLEVRLNCALPSGQLVQPIVSLPILVVSSASNSPASTVSRSVVSQELMKIGEEVHPSCIRAVHVGHLESPTYVFECPGFLGIGGKVWDSSYVLLQYLAHYCQLYVRGKRLLELGSGTGITGIGIAGLDAKSLILTDLAEVVPLLEANVHLNQAIRPLGTKIDCVAHCWGEHLDERLLASDVIIASDVVYEPRLYDPLIESLGRFLSQSSSESPLCILAHRHRHPDDSQFFEALKSKPGIAVELQELPVEIRTRAAASSVGKLHENALASANAGDSLMDVEIWHVYMKN